jgi:hypothetical protein
MRFAAVRPHAAVRGVKNCPQYSPVVYFVLVGNLIVVSEDPENRAADGAPCADSISTLREHMKKLDDMELLVENEGTTSRKLF